MADVIGSRIVCESFDVAQAIADRARQLKEHKSHQFYWSNPRDTGYRACHVLLSIPHTLPNNLDETTFDVELQIRTYYQHLWALTSETFGEQVKEGQGPKAISAYLLELSQAIAGRENHSPAEKQISFTQEIPPQEHLVVVKTNELTTGERFLRSFGNNYDAAIEQLFRFEDSVDDGQTDTLLLVGLSNPKVIATTHAVFLGMKHVPLPNWMPALPSEFV